MKWWWWWVVGVWKWKGCVGGRRGEGEGLTRLGLVLGCDAYAHSLPGSYCHGSRRGGEVNPQFIYFGIFCLSNVGSSQKMGDPHPHLPHHLASTNIHIRSLARQSTCLSSRILPGHRTGRNTPLWRGTNAIYQTSERHTSHCQ